MQAFDLKRTEPLPPLLLPYLRLAYATSVEQIHKVSEGGARGCVRVRCAQQAAGLAAARPCLCLLATAAHARAGFVPCVLCCRRGAPACVCRCSWSQTPPALMLRWTKWPPASWRRTCSSG
jgi:hypothetical protein